MKLTFNKLLLSAALCLGSVSYSTISNAEEVTLYRFFGVCDAEFGTQTDLNKAYGECGTIQTLLNNYNATNKDGVNLKPQSLDWGKYYTLLNTVLSTKDRPDIAIMHRSQLANFTSRDLLEPLDELFKEAGIDVNDFADTARAGITSNGKIYALPFDIHTFLWHINAGLFKQAGLVDANGQPKVPQTAAELDEDVKIMKEKTGKSFLTMPTNVDPTPPRLLYQFMYQQGVNPMNTDDITSQFNSPAGLKAGNYIKHLINDGAMNPKIIDYPSAEQSFLRGDVAVFINGTWGINSYRTQSEKGNIGLKDYAVVPFPPLLGKPATWSDSHMWVVPKGVLADPQKRKAVASVLKFLYDNNYVWARTGHFPVRKSVAASEAFQTLPFRKALMPAIDQAIALDNHVQKQTTINDLVSEELEASYNGNRSMEESLKNIDSRIKRLLRARR